MTKRRWMVLTAFVSTSVIFASACGSEAEDPGASADASGGGLGDGGGGSSGGLIPADSGYTGGDGAPGTCVPYVAPDGTSPQCSDCTDNDGDGNVDWLDFECAGPLDNDEATFGTGIAGDNVDACKQDCFFDGNSGQGDDKCEWDLRCDSKSKSAECPYDPSYKNCPPTQTPACIKNCQKLTPNGCDCFGCCAVTVGATTKTVRLVSTCSVGSIDDPAKCPPCTQTTSCTNPCDTCELCIGKTTLPPECSPDAGGGGQTCSEGQACNATTPCPDGSYCVTGCCVPIVR